MPYAQTPRRVGDSLGEILRRLAPDDTLRACRVWDFWDEVVGETLASRAQPDSFRNGTLVVRVSSHAWLQELQFLKEDLRHRLEDRLGEPTIRNLTFMVGTLRPTQPRVVPRQKVAGGPVALPDLPEIADKELAQAFARLAAARARRGISEPAPGRRRQRS